MEDYLNIEYDDWDLKRICANCGLTFGSHHAGHSTWPYHCCPGNEGAMNWDEGPGTIFEDSGLVLGIPDGTPAICNLEAAERTARAKFIMRRCLE